MKLVIDLGTTTIVMTLASPVLKLPIKETILNQQRFFGADVISRIQASNEGSLSMLKSLIQKNLLEGIKSLLNKSGANPDQIKEVILCANTVMVHLLMGYSCQGLGVYPFKPVTLKKLTLPACEVFSDSLLACPVTIFPGISAFVGGDIVSGLYQAEICEEEELSFFLDLGTNGEMALGQKDRLIVTSAPAGPAFEGGSIKYGMAAVKGAICWVSIQNERAKFKTLQYGLPIGICGSGILMLTHQLLKNNIIDKTGLLKEPYFSNGFPLTQYKEKENICFYQQDIRQIQMAKSAIRAGIALLCEAWGCKEEDIKKVYVAGTFGSAASQEAAISIGLLPASFQNRITVLGNSSLAGGVTYALDSENPDERINHILEKAQVLYLASTPSFEKVYINYMNF